MYVSSKSFINELNLQANETYSIVNILKYWVTKPYCKVDHNVLARMGEFAMSIQSSETMKRLAKELHLASVEHVWFQYFRRHLIMSHCYLSYLQLISPSRSYSTISRKEVAPSKPRDLAIGLLILQGDKYTRLLPADYIAYFQRPSGENNVRDVFETDRSITYWVMHTILQCEDLEARSGLFNFFLLAAEVIVPVDAIHMHELTTTFACRNVINCVILPQCQQ